MVTSATFAERRVLVAGDAGGLCAACLGIFHSADYVRCAPAGGNADDDVFAGGAAAGYIALAELG
jgi:hypothetical protein